MAVTANAKTPSRCAGIFVRRPRKSRIAARAAPLAKDKDTQEAEAFVRRAASVCADAGLHFNRGQRAFFFALGYLGWFISPWFLMGSSVVVAIVLWRRQFASDSRRAICSE